MAGNVAGRGGGSLLRRGRRGRRFNRGRGSGHLSHHLVEQHRARFRLLLAAFAMAIRMLSVAGLADHLRDFAVNHASDGVVQKKPAARAVIVD